MKSPKQGSMPEIRILNSYHHDLAKLTQALRKNIENANDAALHMTFVRMVVGVMGGVYLFSIAFIVLFMEIEKNKSEYIIALICLSLIGTLCLGQAGHAGYKFATLKAEYVDNFSIINNFKIKDADLIASLNALQLILIAMAFYYKDTHPLDAKLLADYAMILSNPSQLYARFVFMKLYEIDSIFVSLKTQSAPDLDSTFKNVEFYPRPQNFEKLKYKVSYISVFAQSKQDTFVEIDDEENVIEMGSRLRNA